MSRRGKPIKAERLPGATVEELLDALREKMREKKPGPVIPDPAWGGQSNDYVWDGEPFWLSIDNAVIYIKLSDLSARLYVDTYRSGEEGGDPMDTALLALPGGPETGEES